MHAHPGLENSVNYGRSSQQTRRARVRAPRRSVWAFLVSLVAIILLLPPLTHAQTLYGTLIGNVTDATGAAVAGATVVATNAGRASQRQQQLTTLAPFVFRIWKRAPIGSRYRQSRSPAQWNKVSKFKRIPSGGSTSSFNQGQWGKRSW